MSPAVQFVGYAPLIPPGRAAVGESLLICSGAPFLPRRTVDEAVRRTCVAEGAL
eukprot:CAMPEP_0194295776 /NCGR_PEP_ID=MMETSP0169-20130528/54313_1 /TAXON_ID=218684 /ORGANISM="Corethron pennatum, Strain L29A3" /LENGTH=53 /DNA_ID=CAMNT_0039045033 /DNA_START=87 /DNA_END=245 /DNA_ORIENTATION=+